MFNLVAKFTRDYQANGLRASVRSAVRWGRNRLKERFGFGDQIQKRRIELSYSLNELFSATVRYGPFRGLVLSREIWWGKTDRAGMLIGIYEREVLEAVARSATPEGRSFIELGAADGYYGVGVLVNGLYARSYCFEISEVGQKTIAVNAALNKVSDRVEVFGAASPSFYEHLPASVVDNCVLLVDIEGAEFDVLVPKVFARFARSTVIVELHDHFFEDGKDKLERFRKDAERHFSIRELTTTSRDLSAFPELAHMSDTDRWLICSEGRRALPHWYLMTPRLEN